MARAETRQEQCCYLRYIYTQLKGILGSDVEPHCLDAETVRTFHVLMPARSAKDSQEIYTRMHNLQVFPRVRSPTIRRKLVARLLGCERILTFKSFHQDMILLEGCYQALRGPFFQQQEPLCRAHVKRHSDMTDSTFVSITSTCAYALCAGTRIYRITLPPASKRS